jgi:hypothetical protein
MQANDYACVEKNRRSPDRAQTALGPATQGFGIGRLVAPRLSANRSLVLDHSLQSSLLHVSVPVHSGSSQGGRDYDSDGFTTTTLRKRDQLKIGRSEWPTNPINKPGPVVISMGSTSMGHRRAVPGTHGRWRRTPPARGSACMASAHRSRRPDLSTSLIEAYVLSEKMRGSISSRQSSSQSSRGEAACHRSTGAPVRAIAESW